MIIGNIDDKQYYKYALDVVSGKEIACKWVKLACNKFLSDLKREDLEFHVKKADIVEEFISCMKHTDSSFAGKPFILLPYQSFIVANVYGFYYTGTNRRRYTAAAIQISRKAGKTQMMAAIALYALIADKEPGAQVFASAGSREQASILLSAAQKLARSLDPDGRDLILYRSEIKFPKTDSFMKVISSDIEKANGWFPSTWICDEIEILPDTRSWDIMVSGSAARTRAVGWSIFTAGFDKESMGYEFRQRSIDILLGNIDNDHWFSYIAELDEDIDWRASTVEQWRMANPSIGVTVRTEFMEEQLETAKTSNALATSILTKNLNYWLDSQTTWLEDDLIRKCMVKDIDFRNFKDELVFVATDLAQISDCNVTGYMVKREGKFYFRFDCYLPENTLLKGKNALLYRKFKQEGGLKITPGNVTDYDIIRKDILKWRDNEDMQIYKFVTDKWNGTQFMIDCTEDGLPIEEFAQNIGNMNAPVKEFERQMRLGNIIMEYNCMIPWFFSSAALKWDEHENCKIVKGGSKSQKIDLCVVCAMLMGSYLQSPLYNTEITVV